MPEVKQEIPEILKTTEESPKEVNDPSVEEKKVQGLKQEMQETPKSQKTESVNKGEINVTEREPETVSKEKESIVQFETVQEKKDVMTTDVQPDQSLAKTIRFEVEVSSTKSSEWEKLPEVKDEIPEILKTTSLKEFKDPGVQDKKVQVLKQEIQETPKSQETESVNKGEIHMSEQEPRPVSKEKEPRIESIVQFETVQEHKDVTTTDVQPDQSLVKTIRFEVEVSSTASPECEKLSEVKQEIPEILKTTEECLKDVNDPGVEEKKVQGLKQEMQEAPKSQETESVNKGEINVTEREPETVSKEKESIVQFETVQEHKDVTTTDVQPDQSLVKTIRFEVEVSSTESPECEKLPEVKDEIPEILKNTSPKEVKDPGAEERKVQVLKQEMQEPPKSQETESVDKGEINVTEHEPKTVTEENESSIQSERVKEHKDVTTTVKTIRFEVEVSSTESPECGTLSEVKQEIPKILITTEESPKEVSDPGVEERKVQVLKQECKKHPRARKQNL